MDFYGRLASALDRLSPPGSYYKKRFDSLSHAGALNERLANLAGMLQSLRDEYVNDYLQTVQEIIHAEMFSNFLDMASYLNDQGYKDPAAVVTGSVLEQHLREIAKRKGGIDLVDGKGKPRKAGLLNQDPTH